MLKLSELKNFVKRYNSIHSVQKLELKEFGSTVILLPLDSKEVIKNYFVNIQDIIKAIPTSKLNITTEVFMYKVNVYAPCLAFNVEIDYSS